MWVFHNLNISALTKIQYFFLPPQCGATVSICAKESWVNFRFALAASQRERRIMSPTMQLALTMISFTYFFPLLLHVFEKKFYTDASCHSIGEKTSICFCCICLPFITSGGCLSFQERTISSGGYWLRGQTWRIGSTSKTEMGVPSCILWHLPVNIPRNAVNISFWVCWVFWVLFVCLCVLFCFHIKN